MPSLSFHSPTNIIILTSAILDRGTGPALPSSQLNVGGSGSLGDVAKVSASFPPSQPTLLLIDQPTLSPALAQRLKTSAVYLGLLFLVDADEPDQVLPLGWAGATDWVSQDDWITNLAPVAIAARQGEMILPSAVAICAPGQSESGEDALIEPLSDREIEVLRLLAQGLTNKDIAQTLCLSILTVKTHLHHIFGKLSVRSRTEAALWATKHGYGQAE